MAGASSYPPPHDYYRGEPRFSGQPGFPAASTYNNDPRFRGQHPPTHEALLGQPTYGQHHVLPPYGRERDLYSQPVGQYGHSPALAALADPLALGASIPNQYFPADNYGQPTSGLNGLQARLADINAHLPSNPELGLKPEGDKGGYDPLAIGKDSHEVREMEVSESEISKMNLEYLSSLLEHHGTEYLI